VYIHVWIYICIYICIHTYLYLYMYTHILSEPVEDSQDLSRVLNVYKYIWTYIYVHTHTYIDLYVYTTVFLSSLRAHVLNTNIESTLANLIYIHWSNSYWLLRKTVHFQDLYVLTFYKEHEHLSHTVFNQNHINLILIHWSKSILTNPSSSISINSTGSRFTRNTNIWSIFLHVIHINVIHINLSHIH